MRGAISHSLSTSTLVTNGSKKDPLDIHFQLPNKNLEANKVFPFDPQSAYVSSYYQESYDFPYNPDPLSASNNYKIYDEMRTDDQVKAAISFKKDQILGSGWQIKCDNEEIVQTIEHNLKETLDCSFEDTLRDILSSFEYGFSCTEVLYRKGETGLIEFKDFKTRPPHGFEFHLNDKGDVQKIVQNAAYGAIDFAPDYFLHHVYQPIFGNPFGRSDLQAAHTSWKAKKFIFRFWAIYIERFAKPTIVGEYPDEFDSAKVARLQAILNTIQDSTTMVVPQGTKLDFKIAMRDSSNIYENAITLLNTMIARAVLMPDLMGVSGEQTKSGSRALGEVQFDLFMGMIRREQESLARKMTQKVISPLVKANWGDQYRAEFEFKPHTKDDASEALKIWSEATRARIWKTQPEEIKHFLESLKFPVSENIEIQEPPPTPPSPFQNGHIPPQKPEESVNKNLFNSKVYRQETKYEAQIDFAEIKRDLDKRDETALNKIRPLAKDIYNDFIDQIKDRGLLTRFKPELINDLSIHHQKPMNQELKGFMKSSYTQAYNAAQKELFPRAEKKFQMNEELLPEEFIELIDAEAFKIVGDYSVNITNKMRNELVQGIKNGVGERDLIKSLRELGDEETDKWLKTVIRTKSTEMFNRARKSYYENDEFAKQIVDAYQFSAILDDRTSDVCRSLDGKVFDKGEFIGHIVPPLHFNCRSLLVPITKFEEYETDKEPSLTSLQEKGGNLIV